MKLTNSPPPHLADGPMWCAQMVGNEDDYYIHLADKLELAKIEDADALAEVRIARVELMSEMGQTQDVLDQATIVAGKDFVQKMTRTVQWLMETGDWDLDEESEEQEQYVGDGNSKTEECGYWSGEDYECEDYQQYEEHEWSGGSSEQLLQDAEDAEDEFRSGSAGEGEEYPQAMEGDALSLRGLKRV
ncbi:uncharacterized protein EDB91DRAFT_1121484 [Suillus paluster]|uniref:uncharacterized protein n=1 Tax=Suillus paluster TaxID=48578 RepID=UPI001B865517|nr:uncharacterized protein EDB91DRAFT_1121484 [Suillus paluster]KAG1745542.1 hypothetical protein EDB91DRAFT_1121484 [Suillus paluster]